VRAPARALVLEDIESWAFILSRAARRAGASEVVVCDSLDMLKGALRNARFDVALLDIGLDPDDDFNSDGVKALEAIREVDGGGTRCVLVTGWQGGDRMDLMSAAQQRYGVDWAYMKEKYEAHAVIAKLAELLEQAPERRLSLTTPMANVTANMEPFRFEEQLMRALAPHGGLQTLYSVVSRLISSAIPLVAMHPASPMKAGPFGGLVGLYWSRALATAVAVGLMSANSPAREESPAVVLGPFVPAYVEPDLIEMTIERNVQGCLWELSGLGRDVFPG
jgi:hypothetical protein